MVYSNDYYSDEFIPVHEMLFTQVLEILSSIRDHRKKVGKKGGHLHLQIY